MASGDGNNIDMERDNDMKAAILTDLSKCIGCGACALACEEINGLPPQEKPTKLSHDAWTALESHGGVNVRRQCMHCLDPACVSVCPVTALQKTPKGPVIYDETRCIGCRYCMLACPYGIPRYDWDRNTPLVQKCKMCDPLLQEGRQPACVEACPALARTFGDLDDPNSEVSLLIKTHRGEVLHPELGNKPKVYYLAPR